MKEPKGTEGADHICWHEIEPLIGYEFKFSQDIQARKTDRHKGQLSRLNPEVERQKSKRNTPLREACFGSRTCKPKAVKKAKHKEQVIKTGQNVINTLAQEIPEYLQGVAIHRNLNPRLVWTRDGHPRAPVKEFGLHDRLCDGHF